MTPRALALLVLCAIPAMSLGAQRADECHGGIHDCPENFYPKPTLPTTPEGKLKLQSAHFAFAVAKLAADAEDDVRADRETKATELRAALAKAFPKVDTPETPEAQTPSAGNSPPSEAPPERPREPREPRERTQTDDRERRGIYVPPCLQEEGRRCIRW